MPDYITFSDVGFVLFVKAFPLSSCKDWLPFMLPALELLSPKQLQINLRRCRQVFLAGQLVKQFERVEEYCKSREEIPRKILRLADMFGML